MNTLLLFVLIAVGEAAWIMSSIQHQTADGFADQQTGWQRDNGSLEAENRELASSNQELEKSAASLESELPLLRQELTQAPAAAAPPAGEPATTALTTPGASPAVPAAAAPVAAIKLNVGDITTVEGKSYHNCHILKVDAANLTVSHQDGISSIPFNKMTPEMQQSYDIDPQTGEMTQKTYDRYQSALEAASQNP